MTWKSSREKLHVAAVVSVFLSFSSSILIDEQTKLVVQSFGFDYFFFYLKAAGF
jgi:hypothetical protein